MNRTERPQRLDELAGADFDLDSFTAERMEFSELLLLNLKDVLNEVPDMDGSLWFWKLVFEDFLLAGVVRKDSLRDTHWTGMPECFAIVNFSNCPNFQEKVRNVAGRFSKFMKTRKLSREIKKQLEESSDIFVGFDGLTVPKAEDNDTAIIARYHPFIFSKGDEIKRKS